MLQLKVQMINDFGVLKKTRTYISFNNLFQFEKDSQFFTETHNQIKTSGTYASVGWKERMF